MLATVEQPVGHTTQGFVNRVTVEVCRSQWSQDADVVVTEQMVVGETGREVGGARRSTYPVPTAAAETTREQGRDTPRALP